MVEKSFGTDPGYPGFLLSNSVNNRNNGAFLRALLKFLIKFVVRIQSQRYGIILFLYNKEQVIKDFSLL